MATLPTPILSIVKAFDAVESYDFKFSYSGQMIFKNELKITNNTSSVVVYDQEQNNMILSHTVDANTLDNNVQYYAQIKVYDNSGNESDWSTKVLFKPHIRPTLTLTGLPQPGHPYEGANLTVNINFNQPEGDTINEVSYYLYDRNKNLINKSDTIHSFDPTEYTYYSLQNLTRYYIRCYGTSTFGFDIDTDYNEVDIEYTYVKSNLGLTVVNEPKGYLLIKTNIIDVPYNLVNDDYEFKDNQLIIYPGNTLTYDVGITSDFDDWSFITGVSDIVFNKVLYRVDFEEGYEYMEVMCVKKISEVYFKLIVSTGYEDQYVLYKKLCNYVDFNPATTVYVLINRKNNLYNLDLTMNMPTILLSEGGEV